MGCPICHAIIAVNQMNPLFLPQYNGLWPAYSRMYRHLTLIRNGIELLNVQNARLFIMEITGNQTGLSIEVSAVIKNVNLILSSKYCLNIWICF